jgi:ferredoxin-NADP reductase/Na+-translocating ferredoxin:NAD+ oxidoreductase RnfD subunit
MQWGLRALVAISLAFSFTGVLTVPFWGLVLSSVLLITSTYLTNKLLSYVWRVQTNTESYILTGLILFFVLPPATTPTRAIFIFLAGAIAMASKFIIAYHGKHIFNPAAFSVALLGIFGLLHSNWWVGSSVLWPFVLLFGLLVLRKIRRFYLFGVFAVISLLIIALMGIVQDESLSETLMLAITSSPLLFLGTIMLTEPSTMPARKRDQIVFAAVVAILFATAWNIGGVHIYPEVALVLGNIYAFAVSPKYRLLLRLKEIRPISKQVYDFVFVPDRKPEFEPGQYMEWTLPYQKHDSRGNRRTFSIASSPTEDAVHLGVKFYEPGSTYKTALRNLKPGQGMYAGQIGGEFTLPKDTTEKLVFIAGGIGITPFRSMLKYIIDTGQTRNIVLFYAVSSPDEIAYKEILDEASKHGVQVIQVLGSKEVPAAWTGLTGYVDTALISERVPDYAERTFFVSGPPFMVDAIKRNLHQLHVGRERIVSDYFPGY